MKTFIIVETAKVIIIRSFFMTVSETTDDYKLQAGRQSLCSYYTCK